jgi:signal peptidase II
LPLNRYIAYFAIAVIGAGLDLGTKEFMFRWLGPPIRPGNEYWLWQDHFGFQTSLNPGALFGAGAGYSILFATLSILAAIGIFFWLFVFRAAHDRWLTVALGFVTGGILGNLYDRLGLHGIKELGPKYEHAVRDWILFQVPEVSWPILNPWPNFNIADTLLVTGAIMLVLHAFLWRTPEEEANAEAGSEDAAGG